MYYKQLFIQCWIRDKLDCDFIYLFLLQPSGKEQDNIFANKLIRGSENYL